MSRRHPRQSRSCAVLYSKKINADSRAPSAQTVHHMPEHRARKKSLKIEVDAELRKTIL
jgi:hypothetical protein